MKFDQKSFPLEADLPDFRPTERVYLGEILKNHYSHVRHCQIQRYTLVILQLSIQMRCATDSANTVYA